MKSKVNNGMTIETKLNCANPYTIEGWKKLGYKKESIVSSRN